MKVNDVIFKYMTARTLGGTLSVKIPSWQLEDDLVDFGQKQCQTMHTASTYARAFRKLRNTLLLEKKCNLSIQDVTHTGVKYKTWRIQPISKLPSGPAQGTP